MSYNTNYRKKPDESQVVEPQPVDLTQGARTCPRCGTINPASAPTCRSCQQPFDESTKKLLPKPPDPSQTVIPSPTQYTVPRAPPQKSEGFIKFTPQPKQPDISQTLPSPKPKIIVTTSESVKREPESSDGFLSDKSRIFGPPPPPRIKDVTPPRSSAPPPSRIVPPPPPGTTPVQLTSVQPIPTPAYQPVPIEQTHETVSPVIQEAAPLPTTINYQTLNTIISGISKVDPGNIKKAVSRIFKKNVMIRPGFSSSWVYPMAPENSVKLTEYNIGDSKVTLYAIPNETETIYHLALYEYSLPQKYVELIQLARAELMQHYPKHVQLRELKQTRNYVVRIGIRLIYKLARKYGIDIGATRTEELRTVKKLAEILSKYVAGLGVIETLLHDKYVQDIYIDAPASENKVHLRVYGIPDPRVQNRCLTNITIGEEDAEALLSRFRLESGRPFSEAFPILETDLLTYDTRVTVVGKPLSPQGLAFALRRHSTDPWTLLKLIYLGSMTPLMAGLLSFLIDGRSTILVSGARGAGKTSLVGALMLEFPQSQRILTIEDSLELPVPEMQLLGYKVQSILVQSPISGGMTGELSANEALKVSLRLGESAIVLGEVRGIEAKTLYEAMRVGTAGSAVLGTIHASSANAVYERVVHDIGISPYSFKATDIIVQANYTRVGGTMRMIRKVTDITELRKESEKLGDFQSLIYYDEANDQFIETEALKSKSERIGQIAKMWGISYTDALQNIGIRAAYRSKIVEYAQTYNKPQLLTAKWVALSNNVFWNLIEKYQGGDKTKRLDYVQILNDWTKWFEKAVRYA